MSDDEIEQKASTILRGAPVMYSDLDRARAILHTVGPNIVAEYLRKMSKRYASTSAKISRDLMEEAERLDRRGRMVDYL